MKKVFSMIIMLAAVWAVYDKSVEPWIVHCTATQPVIGANGTIKLSPYTGGVRTLTPPWEQYQIPDWSTDSPCPIEPIHQGKLIGR